VCVLARWNENP